MNTHSSITADQFDMLKALVRGPEPTAVIPVPHDNHTPAQRLLYQQRNMDADALITLGFLRDITAHLSQPLIGNRFRAVIVTNEAVQLVLEVEFAKPV